MVRRNIGTIGTRRTRIKLQRRKRGTLTKRFRGGAGQPVFAIRKGRNARKRRR